MAKVVWRRKRRRLLRRLEYVFWAAGVLLLGIYAYVYLDRSVYQAYEDWSFDRELQGEPAPVLGFVLHGIKIGRTGEPPDQSANPAQADENPGFTVVPAPEPANPGVPHQRGLIGRIEIPRIGVRAMVRDNTDSKTLRRAVGHIEGTALPGEDGNVALAGHRDTFFSGLRNVRKGDTILLNTLGGTYVYRVDSTRVVRPSDTSVLEADQGKTLTLVTCYPFNYVGPAPKRFIVKAREVTGPQQASAGELTSQPQPARGS